MIKFPNCLNPCHFFSLPLENFSVFCFSLAFAYCPSIAHTHTRIFIPRGGRNLHCKVDYLNMDFINFIQFISSWDICWALCAMPWVTENEDSPCSQWTHCPVREIDILGISEGRDEELKVDWRRKMWCEVVNVKLRPVTILCNFHLAIFKLLVGVDGIGSWT